MEKIFREYKPEILKQWIDNLYTEVHFWQNWFKTKGSSWRYDFDNRTSKLPSPVDEWVSSMCTPSNDEKFRILDIGSGPISIIRGVTEIDKNIELISVDPLAPAYSVFISETCPWIPKPVFGLAEYASSFIDGEFDLIYSRNALDHSFDPVHAVLDLLKILKPGRTLALEHFENEAENEEYSGLHHWNFTDKNGSLVFWNKDYSVDITKLLDGVAEINSELVFKDGKMVVLSKIKRISDAPINIETDSWSKIASLYVQESITNILLSSVGK